RRHVSHASRARSKAGARLRAGSPGPRPRLGLRHVVVWAHHPPPPPWSLRRGRHGRPSHGPEKRPVATKNRHAAYEKASRGDEKASRGWFSPPGQATKRHVPRNSVNAARKASREAWKLASRIVSLPG